MLLVTLVFFLPESQIFFKQLNYGLSISESILITVIKLVESILESLFANLIGHLTIDHHLIKEDGIV